MAEVNGANGVHESSNKRSPSPERPKSPPAKRLRSDSKKSENQPPTAGTRKPPSRTASTKKVTDGAAIKSRKLSPVREAPALVVKPEQKQLKPYFNQLPTPPPRQRPGLLPFVWGTGNFGQFGLGPEFLEELPKPKRHIWMEKKMEGGILGEPGAGIEFVAAGGLHTVFIDEKGTVCQDFQIYFPPSLIKFQVWTCGTNDNAALGRVTENVPDSNNPGHFLNIDDLTSYPHPIQSLVDEGFRAVKAVAGDSICGIISDQGELRVWGTFRVRQHLQKIYSSLLKH